MSSPLDEHGVPSAHVAVRKHLTSAEHNLATLRPSVRDLGRSKKSPDVAMKLRAGRHESLGVELSPGRGEDCKLLEPRLNRTTKTTAPTASLPKSATIDGV